MLEGTACYLYRTVDSKSICSKSMRTCCCRGPTAGVDLSRTGLAVKISSFFPDSAVLIGSDWEWCHLGELAWSFSVCPDPPVLQAPKTERRATTGSLPGPIIFFFPSDLTFALSSTRFPPANLPPPPPPVHTWPSPRKGPYGVNQSPRVSQPLESSGRLLMAHTTVDSVETLRQTRRPTLTVTASTRSLGL